MVQYSMLIRKLFLFLLVVSLTSNCVEKQEEGVIFCTDPLFPFFCPSSGKCCSLPFYGKNLSKCYATIAECGASGQSCESCAIEPNNSLAATFVYANWDCGGDAQCEIDLGGSSGTAGPFCSTTACMAWGDKYASAGYTCDNIPTHTPNIGPPPDDKCFKVGDF